MTHKDDTVLRKIPDPFSPVELDFLSKSINPLTLYDMVEPTIDFS